jgi:prophage DNA circulation protein
MPASSTLENSFGAAATQFAAQCLAGASDATALFRVIYGLNDGKDYGRYFFGQNSLITFADAATSLSGLIAQSVTQQQAVESAVEAFIGADTDPTQYYGLASLLTEAVRTACANPADAVRILSGLVAFSVVIPYDPIAGDPLGTQIYLLSATAANALRKASAASLVRATQDYVPTSQQDAFRVRDQVASLLDDLATYCADIFDDASADALDAARVAIVEDLSARGGALASVETLSFNANLPALVLAYRLYGDATRAGDLVARNSLVPDPGFMPSTIEALTA